MNAELQAYARTFPSQGGVEIGDYLAKYASEAPAGSAIVEVGCWLGAGTAHLALGAMQNIAVEMYVFDRWKFDEWEVKKARDRGFDIKLGEDTLPRVAESLTRFPVSITYFKGNIIDARWDKNKPIGLYVDDAAKKERFFTHAMETFGPAFIPGRTILVLMDYNFDEKAGPVYAAQKRYMRGNARFEQIEDRIGGTSAAVFRYLG